MLLKSIRIQNLRTFSNQTIEIDDYTCLVGPNGSGKSTILCALNIFFRESEHSSVDLTCLEEQDFHNRRTENPVQVTVTFANLSANAQDDLKEYYRNGELTITAQAIWDPVEKCAIVKHYGERLAMEEFAPFFEAYNDNKPAAELKEIFANIKASFSELKATTKEGMREALRDYESKHPERCKLIPSEDQFYGATKGSNRIAKYVQWVYVPAVKDAVSEQIGSKDTALAKLVARVVQSKVSFQEPLKQIRDKAMKEYQELLAQKQSALADVSKQLADLVAQYAHPDAKCRIEWTQDPEKSVKVEEPLAALLAGEGAFEGGVARFGHGLQRSLLLGLLQLVAGVGDSGGPKLLIGIEEPELFQHPPQARHLAEVLQNLSEKNTQIIVSTHSPYFVVGKGVESVRMIRKNVLTGFSTATSVTFGEIADAISGGTGEDAPKELEGIRARIHQELQPLRNEIFFSAFIFLVEGLEDIAYITAHLHLTGKWTEFRRLGCHLVPAEGKSHMPFSLAIMNLMHVPFFVAWDSDSNQKNTVQHEKENKTILKLVGEKAPIPFPPNQQISNNYALWKTNLSEAIDDDFSGTEWENIKNKVRADLGNTGGFEKSSYFIAECLARAYDAKLVSKTLTQLCEAVVAAATRAKQPLVTGAKS